MFEINLSKTLCEGIILLKRAVEVPFKPLTDQG